MIESSSVETAVTEHGSDVQVLQTDDEVTIPEAQPKSISIREETTLTPDIEEDTTLPLLEIDAEQQVIKLAEREVKLRGKISWSVFHSLSQQGDRGLSLDQIKQIAKEAGAKNNDQAIHNLKNSLARLQEDPSSTSLIERRDYEGDIYYRLRARTEQREAIEKSSPRHTQERMEIPLPKSEHSTPERPVEKSSEQEMIRENIALISSLIESRVGTVIQLGQKGEMTFTLTKEIKALFSDLPEDIKIKN